MTSVTSLKSMALAILGASVGAVIYFWGTASSPASLAFFRTPEFITWFLINEVLFALYPILWVFVLKPIGKLKEQPTRKQLEIIGSSVLLTGLFMFPLLVGARVVNMQPLPFEYADLKILIIEAIGFLGSALPIAVSIWLTQAAVRNTFGDGIARKDIPEYIAFRDQLHRYLTILGVLLSLFVLASAALRTASLATGMTTAADYPPTFVLIVGVYYTCLATLVYLPAHQTLASAGHGLLEACFPLPAPDSDDWSTAYSNRKSLEELLELKVTVAQRLQTSVALLAPFFSSIFSLFVRQ